MIQYKGALILLFFLSYLFLILILYVVFVFCFLSFPKDASRPAAHCSFSHDPRVIHEGSWRWMTYWVAPSEMAEREISNYLAEGATWCVIITDIYII